MSSDQPYNELGQILANGGEIALGLAISRGWTSSQIALLFSRRFEPMRDDDRKRLVDVAERAVAAGNALNDLYPDGVIDPNAIPDNPYLFGDDPAGRRARMAGRFTVDEGATWFDFRIDVADIESKSELLYAAEELIRENWSKYPEGKTGGFGGPMPHLTIEIILAEKRF